MPSTKHLNPRMPREDAVVVDAIAVEILAYVRLKPRAKDTAEGIAQWWLSSRPPRHEPRLVQAALDRLVAVGRLHADTLPGGTVVYGGAQEG